MKKTNKPFIQKIKGIVSYFKRISEIEKEKKERIKKAKRSSVKPKGFFARKFGVITFWVLFGFMFLTVVITIFSGNGEANANKTVVEVKENYAISPEAIQYARNFTKEYFTWEVSDEGKNNRKEIMTKYLAEGLDPYAGLLFEKMEWNATFKDAEIKKVEEKGDNLSHITFLVKFELTKGKEKKQTSKYFVVPVAYDGKTFGIYELPKFTYIYEDTTLKKVVSEKLKQAEVNDSKKIKEFLPTFFRSYSEDTKDKLNYILSNEKVTDGLNKTMVFEKINNANIFVKEGEENKKEFVVFTEVVFIEPETNISFVTNYQLTVVEKDERYVVSGIDDQDEKTIETKELNENDLNN